MNLIISEFQKLKRYNIILVGIIGVTFSPIISVVMQNVMSDDAKTITNYAFPDLLNSTVWNNMTIFFPMILALIGGYMINREYTDDTFKNILTLPISFPRLIASKLTALSIISIILGIYNALVTIIIGAIFCNNSMSLGVVLSGVWQIIGMSVFTCIADFPLIALCGRKKDLFKAGIVITFLLGYFTIYFKSPMLRNLYPFSAGLSIIQFDGIGFVSDTAEVYSSTQNVFVGICVLLIMLIITVILINIPRKETIKVNISTRNNRTRKRTPSMRNKKDKVA